MSTDYEFFQDILRLLEEPKTSEHSFRQVFDVARKQDPNFINTKFNNNGKETTLLSLAQELKRPDNVLQAFKANGAKTIEELNSTTSVETVRTNVAQSVPVAPVENYPIVVVPPQRTQANLDSSNANLPASQLAAQTQSAAATGTPVTTQAPSAVVTPPQPDLKAVSEDLAKLFDKDAVGQDGKRQRNDAEALADAAEKFGVKAKDIAKMKEGGKGKFLDSQASVDLVNKISEAAKDGFDQKELEGIRATLAASGSQMKDKGDTAIAPQVRAEAATKAQDLGK